MGTRAGNGGQGACGPATSSEEHATSIIIERDWVYIEGVRGAHEA